MQEEATVLQPQWDALSEVVLCMPSHAYEILCSSSLQALSSLRGLHGGDALISSETALSGEGSAEADAAVSRRRLSRRS